MQRRLFAVQAERLLDEIDRYLPAAVQTLRQAVRDPMGIPLPGQFIESDYFMFSPDGEKMVTSHWDNTLRVWPVAQVLAGEAVVPQRLVGHTDRLATLAFHPNGNWLASGGLDGTVRLWSMQSEDEVLDAVMILPHDDKIMRLLFTPDGKRLITGSWDQKIRIWDVSRLPAPLDDPIILTQHTAGPVALTVSPDSRWLFTSAYDALNLLWDLTDLEAAPQVIEGHEVWANGARFTADSQRLVTASPYSTLRIYETADLSAEPILFNLEKGRLWTPEISPDGRWLTVPGDPTEVHLWDLTDLEAPPLLLSGHTATINRVEFSPDGRWLASASRDGTAQIWAMDNLQAAPTVLRGHGGWFTYLHFHPSLNLVGTIGLDRFVRLWPLDDLSTEPRIITNETPGERVHIVVDPTGQWLISTVAAGVVVRKMSDLAATSLLLPHESTITALAVSPDARWLGTGSFDGVARLWATADWSSGQPDPVVLDGHGNEIWSATFSSDSGRFVTGGLDGNVFVWDVAQRQQPIYSFNHPDSVVTLDISRDGRWLATHDDEDIWLWPLTTDTPTPTVLSGHTSTVSLLRFSPDNRWLLSLATQGAATDYTARLWSLDDLAAAPYMQTMTGIIRGAAFSPDSQTVALSMGNASVYLWSTALPAEAPRELSTDGANNLTLNFSQNGEWLASETDTGMALWSMAQPEQGAQLLDDVTDNAVTPVFSPDGQSVIITGEDGIIALWTLNVAHLVDRACATLGRNFTLAEWEQYLPNTPYQATCPQWPAEY